MSLLSCSKNDITEEKVYTDKIIGEWKLTHITVNGENHTNRCNTKGVVHFKSDKSLSSEFFGSVRGACTSAGIKNGYWKNENNSYSINFNDVFPKPTTEVSLFDNDTKLLVMEEIEPNTIVIRTFIKL
ncbi:lipocalin-like domain-containing protein [Tenacibaculum xiamenense]|uniref:lipocalin family protein n=1 Tax=Tenacibaculum xiamenense TaxID=1261553 RepID=UPI0038B56105